MAWNKTRAMKNREKCSPLLMGSRKRATTRQTTRKTRKDRLITLDWYLICSSSGYSTLAFTRVPWVCRVAAMASTLTHTL